MDVEVALVFFVIGRMRFSQELHVTFCHMKSKVARAFSPRALRPRENSTTTPRLTVTGFGVRVRVTPHGRTARRPRRGRQSRTHTPARPEPSPRRTHALASPHSDASRCSRHWCCFGKRTHSRGGCERKSTPRPTDSGHLGGIPEASGLEPTRARTRARACRRRVARLVVPRTLRAPAPRWAAGS